MATIGVARIYLSSSTMHDMMFVGIGTPVSSEGSSNGLIKHCANYVQSQREYFFTRWTLSRIDTTPGMRSSFSNNVTEAMLSNVNAKAKALSVLGGRLMFESRTTSRR